MFHGTIETHVELQEPRTKEPWNYRTIELQNHRTTELQNQRTTES